MPVPDLDYFALFKGMPANCVVLDRDLRFVTASDRYLKTIGMPMEAIKGRYVFEPFPETEERQAVFLDAFRRALAGEANSVLNVPYQLPDPAKGEGAMREVWWNCHHTPVRDAAGAVAFVVQKAEDVTRAYRAEQLKDAVVSEMQHRVSNILSLVDVIARRTAAHSDDIGDFLSRFEGRIRALARTHGFLSGNDWESLTLERIVSRQMEELNTFPDTAITAGGSLVKLNASEAQIMTLAVHELATNAVKYGALRAGGAALSIRWDDVGRDGFSLSWEESGVAARQLDDRRGFGSVILEEIVPAQMKGEATRELADGRYLYRLVVPARVEVR